MTPKHLVIFSIAIAATCLSCKSRPTAQSSGKDLVAHDDQSEDKKKVFVFYRKDIDSLPYVVRGSCPPAMVPSREACNLELLVVPKSVFAHELLLKYRTPEACRATIDAAYGDLIMRAEADLRTLLATSGSTSSDVATLRENIERLKEFQAKAIDRANATASVVEKLDGMLFDDKMQKVLVDLPVATEGIDSGKGDLIFSKDEVTDPRAQEYIQSIHTIMNASGMTSILLAQFSAARAATDASGYLAAAPVHGRLQAASFCANLKSEKAPQVAFGLATLDHDYLLNPDSDPIESPTPVTLRDESFRKRLYNAIGDDSLPVFHSDKYPIKCKRYPGREVRCATVPDRVDTSKSEMYLVCRPVK